MLEGAIKVKKINKIKVLGVIFLMIGIVTCLCFLMNHQNKLVTHKIKNYQSNDDELLTLVNFENTIPEDWKVDLVRLNNNQLVDRRIYKDLTAMLKVAKSEGLNLLICSLTILEIRTLNRPANSGVRFTGAFRIPYFKCSIHTSVPL